MLRFITLLSENSSKHFNTSLKNNNNKVYTLAATCYTSEMLMMHVLICMLNLDWNQFGSTSHRRCWGGKSWGFNYWRLLVIINSELWENGQIFGCCLTEHRVFATKWPGSPAAFAFLIVQNNLMFTSAHIKHTPAICGPILVAAPMFMV